MGRQTEQAAMHKERYLVPIRLNMIKLSGVGEDTMFIGIIEVGAWIRCVSGPGHLVCLHCVSPRRTSGKKAWSLPLQAANT
jgi:hypothetical protein